MLKKRFSVRGACLVLKEYPSVATESKFSFSKMNGRLHIYKLGEVRQAIDQQEMKINAKYPPLLKYNIS